MVNSQFNIQ